MKRRASDPDEIVAEFQRRRRVTRAVSGFTAALGLGGGVLLVAYGSLLHGLADPPYGLFAAFLGCLAVFVIGAIVHPQLYRCPGCGRRVEVPDPTESGNLLLDDPERCPHCAATLKHPAARGRAR